jgi:6,7-dimethyl-8-ribityllumazine synthase
MPTIGLVIGSFHKADCLKMLETARRVTTETGLSIGAEVWVPGSMEKPLALKRLLLRDDIDGAVALGIIERGETKHGLVMGQAVVNAIIGLQMELLKPIGVGILGPDIHPSQIPGRLEPYAASAVKAVAAMLLESSSSY